MENIIIFQAHTEAKMEISELFQNKGYMPFFAESLSEISVIMNSNKCSKTFMYVKNFSDIRLLRTIKSMYGNIEINLIIPPHLSDIIKLLKNNTFNIFDDITGIL
ncbi:MAG: hypothetical protein RAP70_11775 [Candidatus Celaenobacter antarcticus]|nr:hypothetical protein [Candidatus Celaenobacter antarcticus]